MIINGEQRKGRRAVIAALSVCLFIILIFGSLWARTSFSGRQSEEAAVSVASDAAEAISVSAASEKSEGSFTAEPGRLGGDSGSHRRCQRQSSLR